MFNKKSKDTIWTDLVVKILTLYTKDNSYIDQAIDLSDPLSNKSSQRLAARILIALADRVSVDKQPELFTIFIRLSRGPHYELRITSVTAFTILAQMQNVNRI
jgi:hypothetical protein